MSTAELADRLEDIDAQQAAGQVVKRGKTVFDVVRDHQAQFEAALPATIGDARRFVRVATTTLRTNPTLAKCTQSSLLGALMLSAQLGLEPGGPLGHAYLVPFRNNKTKEYECTFIPGYKGLIDLARRSGHIASIYAHAVYAGDDFTWQLGLHQDIHHLPTAEHRDDPTTITHVYAVARFRDKDSEPVFVVLTRAQVESFRARSKSKDNGPWVTDWAAMALKTATKRLTTWLPMSVELARASAADDQVLELDKVTADDFIDLDPVDEDEVANAEAGAESESASTNGSPASGSTDPAARAESAGPASASDEELARVDAEVAEMSRARASDQVAELEAKAKGASQ